MAFSFRKILGLKETFEKSSYIQALTLSALKSGVNGNAPQLKVTPSEALVNVGTFIPSALVELGNSHIVEVTAKDAESVRVKAFQLIRTTGKNKDGKLIEGSQKKSAALLPDPKGNNVDVLCPTNEKLSEVLAHAYRAANLQNGSVHID